MSMAAVFCVYLAVAQKGLPAVGKIDKADLEMTDCDFDKGADAVKLIDWGNMYYDRGTAGISTFKTIYERRIRIKILKEKGLSQADVKITYFGKNDNEKLLKLEAYTYNLDAGGNVQVTEVKKSSMFNKKIDGERNQVIITFPEVKVGSVIEYRYRMDREDYNLRDWVFQDRIPVRYSEYQLTVPRFFRFTVQEAVVDPMDKKESVITERINIEDNFIETESLKSNYVMRNLPGIPVEPFMGSAWDYVQRLDFTMSQYESGNGVVRDLRVKWSDAINDLNEDPDFGKQLESSLLATVPIVEKAKLIKDQRARVKFLHTTVRDAIRWDGENYFRADKGIEKAWNSKNGNAADINLLLVKLLRDAGIPANPILFSTRDNGIVNTFYPFLAQFNTVMAVVNIDGNNWIVDATDRVSNISLTPEKIVNTKGFIVSGANGRWIEVLDVNHRYRVMAAVQGEIDAEGFLKGNATVNCREYARKVRVEDWNSDPEKFKNKYFTVTGQPIKTDELVVNNLENDSLQLEQKLRFSIQLNSSGEYRYFNTNLFSGLDKNHFISDTRISDVDFGVLQEYTIFGNYTIPAGYTFEELPKDITMLMPDNSIEFTRNIQPDDNLLNIRISLKYKSTFYPATQYAEFKEFHKKLFKALNEQIVIKKKP